MAPEIFKLSEGMCIPVWTERGQNGEPGTPHLECDSLEKASWVKRMNSSTSEGGKI